MLVQVFVSYKFWPNDDSSLKKIQKNVFAIVYMAQFYIPVKPLMVHERTILFNSLVSKIKPAKSFLSESV